MKTRLLLALLLTLFASTALRTEEAENADAARSFAESDPAVLGGVMTVEVRPFALVLLRKS